VPLDQIGHFFLSRAYSSGDIRGEVGREVQAEDALRLGRAVGFALEQRGAPKRVVIGGDVRLSTPKLKTALVEGLLGSGCHVYDLGTVPTPALYLAKERLHTPAGIMVTASHNPPDHNGFKPIIGDLPNTEQELRELWAFVEHGRSGKGHGIVERTEILDAYLQYLKGFFHQGSLRVVIDSGNGCCGPLAPVLFRDLGYQVVEQFSEPDGHFPNRAPDSARPENLNPLALRVVAEEADLGICYDGDGDRASFVDEKGQVVDNDRTFVLYIRHTLRRPRDTVVYDLKCSDIVPQQVIALGGTPVMEKTGHTFIKRAFLLRQAQLAGELTGHYCFRELGRDDGIFASLRMAEIAQAAGEPLSAHVARIPRYHTTPDLRFRMDEREIAEALDRLRSALVNEATVIEIDGVRAQYSDGWGLARASITAPELTLRFEGHTPEGLQRVIRRFQHILPELDLNSLAGQQASKNEARS
jgi:phosphomannomutase/phosphoglucomutase